MILWDAEKSLKLQMERGIFFEAVMDIILKKEYYDILENPSRENQFIFIIPYRDYTHVVPFIIDDENNIVLKTVFPSRKFHKIYGEKS